MCEVVSGVRVWATWVVAQIVATMSKAVDAKCFVSIWVFLEMFGMLT